MLGGRGNRKKKKHHRILHFACSILDFGKRENTSKKTRSAVTMDSDHQVVDWIATSYERAITELDCIPLAILSLGSFSVNLFIYLQLYTTFSNLQQNIHLP
jgi:hypothetical protein